MNAKIEFDKDQARIATVVARKAGIPGGVVAPNVRIREAALTRKAVELPEHREPIITLAGGFLWPLGDLSGVRLGMCIGHVNGLPSAWSIVIRRDGCRLAQIDYASEALCESELGKLRTLIANGWAADPTPTEATKATNFNPATGQEIK